VYSDRSVRSDPSPDCGSKVEKCFVSNEKTLCILEQKGA
jgi:hypothetical protein